MCNPNIEPIEQLSYDALVDTVDLPLLRTQLAYLVRNSGFYREKLQAAGWNQKNVAVPEEFSRIPFTEKHEVLAEQERFPPFGRLATGDDHATLRRIHVTSGSSGKALYVVLSERDVQDTLIAGRRAFRCAGLTPQDTVVHCLNYCLWAGGLTDHLSLEATGATVIPFGVGNTRRLIEAIRSLKPTAISCTPSYMSRLHDVLSSEFGLAPRELGLRKAFFGGEGGMQNTVVRQRIEDTWGLQAIDANYGMADVLSIFGAECELREGLHFHGQGILHLELVDPSTGINVPLQAGCSGELVVTNLTRQAQPVLRLRTRDIVRITKTERCACGRSSPRFVVMGRVDDMIVVRGVNVFPSSVKALLDAHPALSSGQFEIVLDQPPPLERPLLRVELPHSRPIEDATHVAAAIAQACHMRLSFTPRVEILAFGSLPRTEGKTKWVRRTYVESLLTTGGSQP